ncbi:hypothetical protein MP638_001528 [Amoeboaphelidium occidentale]|nr:hypothetical protein MP638_001528 [Amoeboaphelidium occidentale]
MSYKRSADQAALNNAPQPQIEPKVTANTPEGVLVDNVLLAEELLRRRQTDNPPSINDSHVALAINNAANVVNQPLMPILQQLQQQIQQVQQGQQQMQQQIQQVQQGQQQTQQNVQQLLNRTSIARQAALNGNVRTTADHSRVLAVPHQDTGELPPDEIFPADLTLEEFQKMTAPRVNALVAFYGLNIPQGTPLDQRRRTLGQAIGLA